MPKKKGKDQVPTTCLGGIAVLAIIIFGVWALTGSTVGSYWEVQVDAYEINHNSTWYSETDQPYDTTTWGAKQIIYDPDPTLPNENYPYASLDAPVRDAFGNIVGEAQDYYDPNLYGSPNIDIQVGNPRHVIKNDISGEWDVAADSIPFRTYVKPISDTEVRVYDHHVYLYDVSFTTDADYADLGLGVGWQGEFSGSYGVEATILLRTIFSLESWVIAETLTFEDGDYSAGTDSWAGIMSAYVESVYIGCIGETDYTEAYHVRALSNEGAALNMYVDGVPEAAENPTNPTAIVGVPQSVEIECGAVLLPGASSTYILGVRSGVAIRNVECLYTIRVDVLTSNNYYFITGDPPTITTATEVNPPPPPLWDFSWLGEIFNNPYTIIILMVIIVVVAIVGIKIISMYLGYGKNVTRRGQ